MVKGEKAFFTVSDRSDHKMPGLMVFIQGTAEGVKGGEVTFIKQVSSPVFISFTFPFYSLNIAHFLFTLRNR